MQTLLPARTHLSSCPQNILALSVISSKCLAAQELFEIDLEELGKVAAFVDSQDEGRRDLRGIHKEVSTILYQVPVSSPSPAPGANVIVCPLRRLFAGWKQPR